MARKVLDSNYLMNWWQRHRGGSRSSEQLVALAKELLELHGASGILRPIRLELLAGVRNPNELQKTRDYLDAFPLLDEHHTLTDKDWEQVERIASRVVRSGEARSAMDCLIRALANALGADVLTADRGFPSK